MPTTSGKYAYLEREGRRPQWVIAATPDTTMMLKRNFPGHDQDSQGWVYLTVTPESSRRLEWFMDLYPLQPYDAKCLAMLNRLADQYRNAEVEVMRVLDGDATTWDYGAREPALKPRDYQLAVPALLRATGGLLLGDDLGLGKSLSATLRFCEPGMLPALVVAPTHLVKQWRRELALYYPWLTSHIITQTAPYEPAKRRGMNGRQPDILIVNYHKLHGWGDHLAGKIRMMVCDEADELRTGPKAAGGTGSRWYTAAAMIARLAECVVLATATPIHNYGNELFNLVEIYSPGALGSKEEFTQTWGGKHIRNPRALGSHLRARGLMLRRTRKDVGRELPPVSPIEQAIDTDHEKLEVLLSEGVTAMARLVLDESASEQERFTAAGQLNNRVRHATGLAKAPFVAEWVRLLLEQEDEENDKVLLVGWHHDVYEVWEQRLAEYNPVRFTGRESPTQKDANLHRFLTDPKCRVMLLSLRSGAGINGLQEVCWNIVFGELDWTPAKHKQVIGRCNRDGQVHPITAWFLVTDDGSDPPMAETLDIKTRIATPIVDPDAPLVEDTAVEINRAKVLAENLLRRRSKLSPAGRPGLVAAGSTHRSSS
ncbi:DEAD/DEAH box helicase [Micromonospora sp. NPDC049662]|uniref:DEAD/DEAH box helicase n=1 Tax=Micromonospora sp. NPDC049662 TaxID=3155397 RepID=UPI00341CCA25